MSETKPPRRRARRILIWGLGGLLLAAVLLLALAPTIIGAVAPGYAADAINKSINGKASVGSVSLSWSRRSVPFRPPRRACEGMVPKYLFCHRVMSCDIPT